MDHRRRFLAGVLLGAGGLWLYATQVGVSGIASRAASTRAWGLGLLVVLVVLEGLADGIGVWASVRPLAGGVSWPRSVQFALAGDFFDVLGPGGAVTSEPIVAHFVGVATGTSYGEALGVRGVAKYVKAGSQVLVSGAVGVAVLAGDASAATVTNTLGLAFLALVLVGALLLVGKGAVSRVAVAVLAPVLAAVTARFRSEPLDRPAVEAAVDRFWRRVIEFRSAPGLLVLVGVAGVLEQVLVASTLWILLAASGNPVAFLPVLVVVPLPQAATVAPIPASLGAYDVLLSGALVVTTGLAATAATAVVLLFRTASITFSAIAGGVCVAFLRGWRPSAA